ncbi:hypothetical protein J2Y45_002240 [Dyadobacter sp. BE34]|uniref:Uncharacterized protein n=1 Tax=Dyadobacter fermentans TaxID=94254 RepID=A0ABU1QWB0_9BACT|nr:MULTISPECIES: hypothetical protein [Dyadobacter]MDR6805451.1 hypothetical protein [Dyadobacter fermentans]MDR7042789.1 hypothetical protein [Dyadobacter sp. BE242]MDR7197101.1 hypothetical protein [Dyadobacter sp. BE34]MDR7215464.1 hypothetical protein [Dyadobacter sp. BE31]MDR7263000.1 hypothetical protein [Dyadobacter sp. BE32]
MTIQEQIIQDVATVTENTGLKSQLYDYLQSLKSNKLQQPNKDAVLSYAGTIQNDEAEEMLKIIDQEFGKVDDEWR